jgi:hypothetical protein
LPHPNRKAAAMVGVIPVTGSEAAGLHRGGLGEGEFGPPREAFSFRSAVGDALSFVELAVGRVAEGEGGEGALRELEAFLIEILALVERDPGLALAADDLHRAAAMIVGDLRPGREGADVRRRRLLLDAARRFRARLDAAGPSRACLRLS